MRNLYLHLIFLYFICQSAAFGQNDISALKEELIRTDSEFSEMSVAKGRNAAFIHYAAEDAVLMRPNGYPLTGKDEITKQLQMKSDSTYTLTWKPVFSSVAESGEMGYTYGTWKLALKNNLSEPQHEEGTYATIWKKDKEGRWKFVLDVGNEGLKPK